jgi:hypothetical protein
LKKDGVNDVNWIMTNDTSDSQIKPDDYLQITDTVTPDLH